MLVDVQGNSMMTMLSTSDIDEKGRIKPSCTVYISNVEEKVVGTEMK